jgi:uncharacterized DUF497 family protein
MYQVDGFAFDSRKRAKQAKKEKEGVDYIRKQTSFKDPDTILKLYNKLLDEGFFQTEVGIGFLRELQEHLRMIPYIKSEDIRPIPVVKTEEKEKTAPKAGVPRRAFQASVGLNIILAVCIAGMFLITALSGNNRNILNYENEIIDKYEAWETDLENRQSELDAWEAELELREQQIPSQQE